MNICSFGGYHLEIKYMFFKHNIFLRFKYFDFFRHDVIMFFLG